MAGSLDNIIKSDRDINKFNRLLNLFGIAIVFFASNNHYFMNTKVKLLSAVLMALFVSSCSTPNDGITGYTLEMRSGSQSGKNTTIQITKGNAIINQVELEASLSDTTDIEVDVEGIYRFDLITGESTPTFPIAQIPTGIYNELEIGLWQNSSDTTIELEGVYTDSFGNDIPLFVTITESIGLEIEDDLNGFQIDTNTINNLVVYWDFESILINSGIDSAVANNGQLKIDAVNNEAIYDLIVEKLNIEIEVDDND